MIQKLIRCFTRPYKSRVVERCISERIRQKEIETVDIYMRWSGRWLDEGHRSLHRRRCKQLSVWKKRFHRRWPNSWEPLTWFLED